MATLYAQSTGNWSAITWNTAANGSGSNQTPAEADTLVSNNYTVTVDADYTVTKVTNTGGGTFSLANGFTLTCTDATAGVVGDAANVGAVTMSLASPNAATLAAKVKGGDGANEYGVLLSDTGQITISNTVTGGSFSGAAGTGADGVYVSAAGTLIVNAAVNAGSGGYARGINCAAVAATINITGNITGTIAQAPANSGSSTSTITITGNVTGGSYSTAYGLSNAGTGNIILIGTLQASATISAVNSTAGRIFATGPFLVPALVSPPTAQPTFVALSAVNWRWKIPVSGTVYMEFYDDSDINNPVLRTFYPDSSLSLGYPAAADVRKDTVYGQTNNVTGTCAVPVAASVLYGVNVDATTGTATLSAADIRAALGLASANLDSQLSGISAKTDNLPASPAAVGSAMTLTAAYDLAKTASQFDPATDVVAHVTLADTVTTLTNAPDVPTESEIAAAVWGYVTRTMTSGGLSAAEVWEYVSTLLPDNAETMLAGIAARLAEQVPTGPVVVIPAPAAGQTTAWTMCYDETGEAEEGVSVSVKLIAATGSGAYDKAFITATSEASGLVSLAIPRGAGLQFSARRGTGPWTAFSGVDAETLALPALLGMP